MRSRGRCSSIWTARRLLRVNRTSVASQETPPCRTVSCVGVSSTGDPLRGAEAPGDGETGSSCSLDAIRRRSGLAPGPQRPERHRACLQSSRSFSLPLHPGRPHSCRRLKARRGPAESRGSPPPTVPLPSLNRPAVWRARNAALRQHALPGTVVSRFRTAAPAALIPRSTSARPRSDEVGMRTTSPSTAMRHPRAAPRESGGRVVRVATTPVECSSGKQATAQAIRTQRIG